MQAQEAQRRLTHIYQMAHDVETSDSGESGYESSDVVENDSHSHAASDSDKMAIDPASGEHGDNHSMREVPSIADSPASQLHTATGTVEDCPMETSQEQAQEAPIAQ